MAKRVAIIEDDAELSALIEYNLEHGGFVTRVFPGVEGTLEQAAAWRPDLIILDVMLPDTDGFELCRRFRKDPMLARTPVLFLTARAEEVDRVLGLEIGGDDYITKPFSPRELVARVKAHLRRGEGESVGVTTAGPFKLDRAAHKVVLDGKELELTLTEFRLLEYFVSNPGQAFTREQLLDAVWGKDRFVTPRTVDVHVRRLRELIETKPEEPRYIATVRGIGYRFENRP